MKRKSILIIHRDDQARRDMHSILSHFDFKLTYADDGLHGLYAAKSGKPDLIISEVDIDILNGLDMCQMIRNEEIIKDIPIIFLHQELDLRLINKAKAINACAFLIKPYINNSLIYAIKRSLHKDGLQINKNREPVLYDDCRIPAMVRNKYA